MISHLLQYGTDGKEDKEFRLLHVYYSNKRATNRGTKAAKDQASKSGCKISTKKVPKKARRAGTTSKHPKTRTPRTKTVVQQSMPPLASPVTASTASRTASPNSMDTFVNPAQLSFPPLSPGMYGDSFDDFPPLGPNLVGYNHAEFGSSILPRGYLPFDDLHTPTGGYPTPTRSQTMGGNAMAHPGSGNKVHNIVQSPRASIMKPSSYGYGFSGSGSSEYVDDLFPWSGMSEKELEPFWKSDPLMVMMMKQHQDPDVIPGDFADYLKSVRKDIQTIVNKASPAEKCNMLNLLVDWAKQVAADPMGTTEEDSSKKPAADKDNKPKKTSNDDIKVKTEPMEEEKGQKK